MEKQPTIRDVLVAMNQFASSVDERFDQNDRRFEKIETRMETEMATKKDVTQLKDELITHIDGFMVFLKNRS